MPSAWRRVFASVLPMYLAEGRLPSVPPPHRGLLLAAGAESRKAQFTKSSHRNLLPMTTAYVVDYIMDDPREAMRLEMKVDPVAWVRKYVAQRLAPGFEVLSVGCGPGLMLREIAKLDPSIRGTGIDISPSRVQAAREKNHGNQQLKFMCGDAQEMRLARNSFDFVYSRMLLQYLPKKEQALDELVRVCKPGGTVLLQDLDGQLLWNYPEDAGLQHSLEQVLGALAKTGFDP